MRLIAIIIALAADQFQGELQKWRDFGWLTGWSDSVRRRFRVWPLNGPLGVMLMLVPPVFLVGVVHYLLLHVIWLLALLFDVAVLLYCLGPQYLTEQVLAFQERWLRGDQAGAREIAAALAGRPLSSADTALMPLVVEAVLVQANRRLLGVLAWFALLGPMGAALYRLAERLQDGAAVISEDDMDLSGAAQRFFALVDWLPVRLAALGYALMGNFQGAAAALRARRQAWAAVGRQPNEALLTGAGLGALASTASDPIAERAAIESVLSLVRRTLILSVVVVGLVTVGYWAA